MFPFPFWRIDGKLQLTKQLYIKSDKRQGGYVASSVSFSFVSSFFFLFLSFNIYRLYLYITFSNFHLTPHLPKIEAFRRTGAVTGAKGEIRHSGEHGVWLFYSHTNTFSPNRKSHFRRESYPFIHASLFFSFSDVSWDLDLDVYAHSKSINRGERPQHHIHMEQRQGEWKKFPNLSFNFVNPSLLDLIQFNM